MAALPTSGELSIGTLNGFFGGSGTAMSSFYRGGGRVPSTRTVYYTAREPSSGQYYTANVTWWWTSANAYRLHIRWANVTVVSDLAGYGGVTSYASGGYTYYRGSLYYDDGKGFRTYYIYRTYPASYTESINTGVPSSGQISLSQFYGAVNS